MFQFAFLSHFFDIFVDCIKTIFSIFLHLFVTKCLSPVTGLKPVFLFFSRALIRLGIKNYITLFIYESQKKIPDLKGDIVFTKDEDEAV